MLTDTQISFEDIDEEYQAFVDKFKPKKTTDDCYTPENIYEVIKNWVVKEYGIDETKILRPFWPGGDYEREEYPEGCTVVDNPPFSILSEICNRYMAAGVRFFLFAPSLTLFSVASGRKDVARIISDASITYENGAEVKTAFVTNLDRCLIRTTPDLREAIKVENDKNLRQNKPEMPVYEYPENVITAAMCQSIANKGVELRIYPEDALFIRGLDDQKAHGKTIFGSGYLLTDKAAADKAAADKVVAEKVLIQKTKKWKLSEREKAAIKELENRREKNE